MLSRKTKYGIKALSHLARLQSEERVPIGTIAQEENIPHKFLESILLSLRKAGFLGSKKGKSGGYYLLQKPEEIKMVEVMRVLEGPVAMVPCVSLNFYERCHDCPDEEACSVHALMLQVRDSTLQVLNHTTLDQLSSADPAKASPKN
ncbi:RrF2 family transcriptional regulator [Croceiramulus getboli]|nr:Rrf2 family transcriptional regulator [Flavobacteriaceae bacterium YJPT1-3]